MYPSPQLGLKGSLYESNWINSSSCVLFYMAGFAAFMKQQIVFSQ